jgi:hypothetical protein
MGQTLLIAEAELCDACRRFLTGHCLKQIAQATALVVPGTHPVHNDLHVLRLSDAFGRFAACNRNTASRRIRRTGSARRA